MSSDDSTSTRTSLQDTIVTLPLAVIILLGLLLVAGIGGSLWVTLEGPQALRETAGHLLVVLSPLLLVVIAAAGVRRTSTAEIDRLVSAFLDRTVLERLALACRNHRHDDYPFQSVTLVRESRRRSYASYRLRWSQAAQPAGQPDAVEIEVKMNVLNIEVLAELPLALPADAQEGIVFIDRDNLSTVPAHPVLRHLHGTLQGSVAEGYAIRASITPAPASPPGIEGRALLRLSLRQKLREHFLASPYLKRYFAEDVTIAIGWMFTEWRRSPLVPGGSP